VWAWPVGIAIVLLFSQDDKYIGKAVQETIYPGRPEVEQARFSRRRPIQS